MPLGTRPYSSTASRLSAPSTVKSGAQKRATDLRRSFSPSIGVRPLDEGTGFRSASTAGAAGRSGTGAVTNPTASASGQTGFTAAATTPVATAGTPAAGGSTATGTNVSGVGGQGQGNFVGDPFTGFAQRYAPGLADQIFDTPGIVLADMLRAQGMDPSGGLYYTMEPLADIANQLYLLQNAGSGDGANEAAINWIAEFFKQGMTPGGRGIDLGYGIDQLLGSGAGTLLGDMLNVQDNRGQVQNMLGMMQDLATAGMHPLMRQALMASLNRAGNEFLQSTAAGTGGYQGNFQDFLRQNYGDVLNRF